MEKTTLSVLAFCLGAGGVAHAQEMIDLQTLRVLEENQISLEEYQAITERFPGLSGNIITAGNYDSGGSVVTAGNYDSGGSVITAGNYDSGGSIVTEGNYSSFDLQLFRQLENMPS